MRLKKLELFLTTVVVIFVAFLLTPEDIYKDHKTNIPDFTVYYIAAKIYNSGNPDKIYDLNVQVKTLQEVLSTNYIKYYPYLYPPQALLSFIPLGHYSLETAFFTWKIINIAATMLLIYMVLYCADLHRKPGALLSAALITITFYPWAFNMLHGQTVILMTLGLWGCQLLARSKHAMLAAVLLVLTAYKPQMLIGPAIYLAVIYRPLVITLAVASVCTIVMGMLLFSSSIWQSYIGIVTTVSGQIYELGASTPYMGNLRALALLLWGNDYFSVINKVSSVLFAANILVTLFIAYKMKHKNAKLQELGFGLSVATSCFFSPWLHTHGFVMLFITAAYIIKYITLKPRYLYIGMLVNFSLLSMYIDGLVPFLNPVLWVTAQLFFIGFLSYHIRKEYMINNKNPAFI